MASCLTQLLHTALTGWDLYNNNCHTISGNGRYRIMIMIIYIVIFWMNVTLQIITQKVRKLWNFRGKARTIAQEVELYHIGQVIYRSSTDHSHSML